MGYNNRKNHLTGNVLSDEWYTPQYIVDKCFNITNLKDKFVLFPFDTEKSVFVKQAKQQKLIYQFNFRDFLSREYRYDILITNPPFSMKDKVFEKCLKNGKDFILVLPETYIFSVSFYDLIDKYKFNYKLFSPKQRVYFIDEQGKQNRPNFHTIIIYVSEKLKENTIEHFYSETK